MLIEPFYLKLIGPLVIHGYGIAMMAAVLVLGACVYRQIKKIQRITVNAISSILSKTLAAGLVGGRLLYTVSEYNYQNPWQAAAFWNGGFSLLGAIIAIVFFLPYTLKRHKLKLFPFLDITSLYAPLSNSIGRMGCLWAGCCHGHETDSIFHVTYKGSTAGAPLGVPLVPVQLYSAINFLVLFLILFYLIKPYFKKRGSLFLAYIAGLSIERFLTDFFRQDRLIMAANNPISLHQWISLALLLGCILFVVKYKRKARKIKAT